MDMDFWVLMTIREHRRAAIHFTEPYLQSRSCFLVRENDFYQEVGDLTEVRVSYLDYEIHRSSLEAYLPESTILPRESSQEAVQALLQGESDAVYLDQYSALQAVLVGRLSTSVRVIDSGFEPLVMGIASSYESAHVADAIRESMQSMVDDGEISQITGRWSMFPRLSGNMMEDLVHAQKRIRMLVIALIVIAGIFALSIWNVMRLRSQSRRLHQLQSSLKDSAERYRAIVENTNDIVYSVDAKGYFRFISPQAARYGIDPKKAISQHISEFVHPEDREMILKDFSKALDTRQVNLSEFRIMGTDGAPVWVEENGSIITDEQGNITGVTGAVRDISERKRAEAYMYEQEARIHALVDTSQDWIWSINLKGVHTFSNPAVESILGYEPEEIQRLSLMDLLYPEDVKAAEKIFEHSIKHRTGWTNELLRWRRKDGTIRFLESSAAPLFDQDGVMIGLQGIDRDITERLRMEDALRASEEKYRTFFENSCDPILIMENGQFVDCNESALTILGCEQKADIIGKRPQDISPEVQPDGSNSDEKTQELIRSTIAQGSLRSEWVHQRQNGELFPVEISLTVLPSQSDTILLGVWRDISARKRAEEQRNKLENELRHSQKMEAIGLLAGGVAHDFNNILGVMTMSIELLQSHPQLDAELVEGLKELKGQCDRAAGVVRQLLAFSRKTVMEYGPVELDKVVHGMMTILRRVLGKEIQVEVIKEGTADLPLIKADQGVLEQALLNLSLNARDAMPQGGRLSLTLKSTHVGTDRLIPYPGVHAGEFVHLKVSDTGCGMNEETLKKIFDPFYTTKEVGKGTGLGLSTVQGIITQHGGWIEASSQINEGTSFDIYLPVASQEKVAKKEEPQHPPGSDHETILFVEDNIKFRSIASKALKQMGHQVIEADCGKEALAIWQEQGAKISLLLTDVMLPRGMSGFDLAEQLKQTNPSLKVIVSSGFNNEMIEQHTHDAPNDLHAVYLPKPYSTAQLLQALNACNQSDTQ